MQRFKKILFLNRSGLDDSDAFGTAIRLATENDAELKIIEVHTTIHPDSTTDEQIPTHTALMNKVQVERKAHLEHLIAMYQQDVNVSTEIFFGAPFQETILQVLRHNYQLVILAPEEHSLESMVFGATDMHLLRKCPCPVWIVKTGAQKQLKHIMAAVDIDTTDGEEQSLNTHIITLSSSLAQIEASKLHLAHALTASYSNQISAHDAHEAWIKGLFNEAGVAKPDHGVDYHMVEGKAEDVIPQLCEQQHIDLLVMGTVARSGIPKLLIGNTAEKIISKLHCSLLAIKPDHFVCPISLDDSM
jgi:nucleotide-binding universal stress UspA family protein